MQNDSETTSSALVQLYCASHFDPHKEDIRILRTFKPEMSRSPAHNDNLLYKKLPRDYRFTSFAFTNDIDRADFIVIPQRLSRITPLWQTYFEKQRSFAEAHKREVILIIGTDMAHMMHVDGAITLKGSVYRTDYRENEIVTPSFSEDLGEIVPFLARRRRAKPIVSFCGFAGFKTWKTLMKYVVRNMVLDTMSYVTRDVTYSAHKRGIYFRRAAISALSGTSRIEARFIIRNAFSGNVTTASVDPVQARKEYIKNMTESDYVLAPKGDGNYSVRFYEALSLGRIPILIDTDMVLPLENIIDYSKFVLRVPHTQIHRVGDIVADFHEALSDDQFIAMQHAARDAYIKYLRYDSFFNVALPLLKEKGIDAFR